VFFGLLYLGDLDEASLFKKVTKFLNFPAASGINRRLNQRTFQDQQKQATSSGLSFRNLVGLSIRLLVLPINSMNYINC